MGVVLLDSTVVIGFLNLDDAHHAAARGAVGDVVKGIDSTVVSAVTYSEVLFGALVGSRAEVKRVNAFFSEVVERIEPVTKEAAALAATLRDRVRPARLRLADALILATADVCGADRVITADRRWKSIRGLRTTVEVLRP